MTTTLAPTVARATSFQEPPASSGRISRRVAAGSSLAAGLAWIVIGVLNIVDGEAVRALEGSSFIWHTGLALFSIALLLCVAPLLYLGRSARSSIGARVSATGHVAIALLATSSNLNGGDFSWFAFVGVPGNLLILGGLVALTVGLVRAQRLPRYVAALPLWYVFAFPMATIGMSVAAGLIWLGVARTIARSS